MTGYRYRLAFLIVLSVILSSGLTPAAGPLPKLQKNHGAWQLIVDGKPFLMLGGELSNNVYESPKDLPFLEMMLDAYKSYDLNTLLVPISWRSLEPKEGTFDYRMIDHLLEQCRKRDLHVVILWFGAIKNGGLHYAPRWVVNDHDRFFRARRPNGREVYAVSPFCEKAWQADIKAFQKLMQRVKEKDSNFRTVIMIQPENETGCQEIDEVRDHSEPANRAWMGNVPNEVTEYMKKHDGKLVAWLQKVWQRNGKKTSGTWPEVFGADVDGQKVFMAYYMAQFVERVASAGKAIYPLPLFVNDWLGSIESPGGPIGGPDYQVMDLWRTGEPHRSSPGTGYLPGQFQGLVEGLRSERQPDPGSRGPLRRPSSSAVLVHLLSAQRSALFALYVGSARGGAERGPPVLGPDQAQYELRPHQGNGQDHFEQTGSSTARVTVLCPGSK